MAADSVAASEVADHVNSTRCRRGNDSATGNGKKRSAHGYVRVDNAKRTAAACTRLVRRTADE